MDPNPRLLILLVLLAFSATVAVAEDGESTGGSKVSLGRRAGGFLHGLKKEAVVEGDHGVALDEVGPGLFDALFASLSMILVSEIGDETFIIAALMAMRHPKSIVLSGALSALYVMTVLSTGLGRIVPNLISRKHTNSAATEKLESGQGKSTLRRFFGRFCTPIFLEAFILTFLAEWGDRSQIATIALATHKNAIGVAVGASLGHTVCTSLAVIGGSMLASKISQRTVATIGGVLFLGFSVSSYFYPPL
uniref:GDT1 family protein n=3 Tax=Oryza TaxID=4527 RepID=A0A0D3HLQ8_9ORYZ